MSSERSASSSHRTLPPEKLESRRLRPPAVLSVHLPVLRFCEVAASRAARRNVICEALRCRARDAEPRQRRRRSFSAAERRMRTIAADDRGARRSGCARISRSDRRSEITIEAESGARSRRRLRAISRARASRASRSACNRSTNARSATLGRGHTPADVERAVALARAAGIRVGQHRSHVCGSGADARDRGKRRSTRAIALGVDHVSTYGLTVEEGTPYAAWHAREPQCVLRRRRRSGALRDRDRSRSSGRATSSTRSATSLGRDIAARTTRTTGPTVSMSDSASARRRIATASALDAYARA